MHAIQEKKNIIFYFFLLKIHLSSKKNFSLKTFYNEMYTKSLVNN